MTQELPDELYTQMTRAVNRADAAATAFNQVLTFPNGQQVPVEGGTVPSMDTRIQQKMDESWGAIDAAVQEAQDAAAQSGAAAQVKVDELKADLANPAKGAEMVAFKAKGTGSIPKPLTDAIQTTTLDYDSLESAVSADVYNMGGGTYEKNSGNDIDVTRLYDGKIISTQPSRPNDPETLEFPDTAGVRMRSISDARTLVESEFKNHAAGDGNYTVLSDGVVFRGNELYFGVSSVGHHPQPGGGDSTVVAYQRFSNGTWAARVIISQEPGINYRDIKVALSPDGQRLAVFLEKSLVIAEDVQFQGGVLYILDGSLNILRSIPVSTPGRYGYGKPVFTSDNRVLVTNYDSSVYLYRTNADINSATSFSQISVLFPNQSGKTPNETVMGIWGDKLIAVCRRQNGSTLVPMGFRYTYDLTGMTGWRDVEDIPTVTGITPSFAAPNVPQWTRLDEPLIIVASGGPGNRRGNWIVSNAFGRWLTPIMYEENKTGTGSYSGIVRTDRGIGVTSYEEMGADANVSRATRVWHTYMRIDRMLSDSGFFNFLASELISPSYGRGDNGAAIYGNPWKINHKVASNGIGVRYYFELKKQITINAVLMPSASNSGGQILASIQIKKYSDNTLFASFDPVAITSESSVITRFPRSSLATIPAGRYYIEVMTENQKAFGYRMPYNLSCFCDKGSFISMGAGIGAGIADMNIQCPIGFEVSIN